MTGRRVAILDPCAFVVVMLCVWAPSPNVCRNSPSIRVRATAPPRTAARRSVVGSPLRRHRLRGFDGGGLRLLLMRPRPNIAARPVRRDLAGARIVMSPACRPATNDGALVAIGEGVGAIGEGVR